MATETENPQSNLIPARPGEPLITEEWIQEQIKWERDRGRDPSAKEAVLRAHSGRLSAMEAYNRQLGRGIRGNGGPGNGGTEVMETSNEAESDGKPLGIGSSNESVKRNAEVILLSVFYSNDPHDYRFPETAKFRPRVDDASRLVTEIRIDGEPYRVERKRNPYGSEFIIFTPLGLGEGKRVVR